MPFIKSKFIVKNQGFKKIKWIYVCFVRVSKNLVENKFLRTFFYFQNYCSLDLDLILTHSWPLFPFYTPWKY